ncbi:hypothetical protein [Hymenobacter sp. IS2118]|uniref:hypothetical protein n=1 Tax=Hymenobacter sp. IS2118 TaxID=1505605 RepID=UPI0005574706|nr:hypothetical protein [Hymenobacter sp. IS2118]
MNKQLMILASALVLVTGCEQAQKAQESYSTISQLSKAGENIEETMDKAKTQRTEREQRGDTLSLPYKELQQYLPTTVSGYTAGELSGQSQKMSGISFSMADREYTAGESTVKVSLVDYNGADEMYQGMAAMYSLGLEQENDEKILGPTTLKMDGVNGMETFYKKDGRAEMSLAINGRFLLNLTADKQKDMSLLKSIAEDMDLEKLSKM